MPLVVKLCSKTSVYFATLWSMSYFFCCYDKISWQKQFIGERAYLCLMDAEVYSPSWLGNHGRLGIWSTELAGAPVLRKERVNKKWYQALPHELLPLARHVNSKFQDGVCVCGGGREIERRRWFYYLAQSTLDSPACPQACSSLPCLWSSEIIRISHAIQLISNELII